MHTNKIIALRKEDIILETVEIENDQKLWLKRLVTDESGLFIEQNIYPAGTVIPKHSHTFAHGIYVLKGKLYTDIGIFEPGSFIWHPAGSTMEHGATDDEDCEVLFICTKEFDITYL